MYQCSPDYRVDLLVSVRHGLEQFEGTVDRETRVDVARHAPFRNKLPDKGHAFK